MIRLYVNVQHGFHRCALLYVVTTMKMRYIDYARCRYVRDYLYGLYIVAMRIYDMRAASRLRSFNKRYNNEAHLCRVLRMYRHEVCRSSVDYCCYINIYYLYIVARVNFLRAKVLEWLVRWVSGWLKDCLLVLLSISRMRVVRW